MAWRLDETGQPAGRGMPLGEMVAADHKPDDPRRGVQSWDGEGHRLLVGPSGSGKYQAAIAPLVLTADHASLIVFDVADGEATRDGYAWRSGLGPVLVLDPFGITGRPAGSLNPLDLLAADDPAILSKARRLTEALMMFGKSGGDADYWNGQARNFLAALLIHVATDPSEAGRRTLKRVREIVRRPFSPPLVEDDPFPNGEVLHAMRASTVADGIVRDEAENLTAAEAERNTLYIQQTMRENTSFLDLSEVQQATATSSIDLATLRERVATLFVVAPEYELRNVGRWLRLVYSVVMEQMRLPALSSAYGSMIPLHVVLDEFPAFGRLDRVRDDMALVRRFNIRMTVAVQKLSQLREIYGAHGWEGFVPVVMHVLGADELFTAEYVSKKLGTTTKPSTSESHDRKSLGGSQGTSRGWVSAPLMPPHEVEQMPKGRCLVLVAGERPRPLRKWALYNSPYLQARASGRVLR